MKGGSLLGGNAGSVLSENQHSLTEVAWFLAAIVGIEVLEELRQAAVINGWQLPF